MSHEPMHEAICKAAGWPAYCDRCGAKMKRVSQLGGAMSSCTSKECHEDQKRDEEARRAYWEEDNA